MILDNKKLTLIKIQNIWFNSDIRFLFHLHITSKAESFYYINYGSSIIMSKVRQIISVMKTLNTGVSREMILQKQCILTFSFTFLSWRQQKHQCLFFPYWDFLTNFWRNNWQSIFGVTKWLCYCSEQQHTQVIDPSM